jgi:A/G-specific adenine glycosylase
MLQQTTVKAVAPYYARFLERFPTVTRLAAAPLDEVLSLWAGLGYYARARNLHACAKAVAAQHGGAFPGTEAELLTLPGIGAYTAAAIAAIAFDKRASPVDGNIERVIARLFAVEEELPGAKPRIRALAEQLTPARRAGDFAQAMMDLGATICTPKKPACVLCPWREPCAARARGDQESFPRKAEKKTGARRRGAAFVVLREGHILLRTRPEKGLLGGMTEVPTTEWSKDFDGSSAASAPFPNATWRRIPGHVDHVFTHFPLQLIVHAAKVSKTTRAPDGMRWTALDALDAEALPNVMRKVIAHALGADALRPQAGFSKTPRARPR